MQNVAPVPKWDGLKYTKKALDHLVKFEQDVARLRKVAITRLARVHTPRLQLRTMTAEHNKPVRKYEGENNASKNSSMRHYAWDMYVWLQTERFRLIHIIENAEEKYACVEIN